MQYDDLLSGSEAILYPETADVRRYRNLWIPTRDGTQLAADVYLPIDRPPPGCLPVVLEYIPYCKDHANLNLRPFYLRLPREGYLFVRVDIRGTGASPGVSRDEYLPIEQQDACDVIEWLADQSWCTGQVNMMGISYGGFTALQVASLAPPHLVSIVPVDFTDDRYRDDCHYRGGLMRLYYNLAHYGGSMIASNAMPPMWESGDGEQWAAVWQERLQGSEPYILKAYRHQVDGPYWRHGSVGDDPGKINCPVFMIGGWQDGYMNCNLRLYQKLSAPKKLLVGPWNHAMPDMAVPGPRIDYIREVIRWLDYWCKNIDTGIMRDPPLTLFMQTYQPPDADRLEAAGQWRKEKTWPTADGFEKTYWLGAENRLASAPGSNNQDTLDYEPMVGVHGGLFSGGLPFGLAGDQRPDEALSVCYDSDILADDLHLLGRAKVKLTVQSNVAVLGFCASLSDVASDGRSHLVAKGIVNLTRRDSMQNPEAAKPGLKYDLEIELDATGWIFGTGHRIRLSISNADWPNVWPTPYPARSQIFHGQNHPSCLILPLVPARPRAKVPELVPAQTDKTHLSSAVEPPVWRATHNLLSGCCEVEIGHQFSHRLSPQTVFERIESGRFYLDPKRPGAAGGVGHHLHRLRGANMVVSAEANITIQATVTHFQFMINLEVRLNGKSYFNRQWLESIPRNLL